MSNMSYVRFENLFNDMEDCIFAIEEEDSARAFVEGLSESERRYFFRFIDSCRNVVELMEDF